jgi:hypothetical protein
MLARKKNKIQFLQITNNSQMKHPYDYNMFLLTKGPYQNQKINLHMSIFQNKILNEQRKGHTNLSTSQNDGGGREVAAGEAQDPRTSCAICPFGIILGGRL